MWREYIRLSSAVNAMESFHVLSPVDLLAKYGCINNGLELSSISKTKLVSFNLRHLFVSLYYSTILTMGHLTLPQTPTYYYPLDHHTAHRNKEGNRASLRLIRPSTHSTMYIEGKQLLTKKVNSENTESTTPASPPRKRQATKVNSDNTASTTPASPPRKRHAKKVNTDNTASTTPASPPRKAPKRKQGLVTPPSTASRKNPRRCTPAHIRAINFQLEQNRSEGSTEMTRTAVDPCAWAENVLSVLEIEKPLTRSLFRQTKVKLDDGTQRYGHQCSFLPTTVDYGLRQLQHPGLAYIGMSGAMTGATTNKDGRFLFNRPDVAVDHMLFSIILLHKGNHADLARGKLLDAIFETSDNPNFACITKINAKKRDLSGGPLFCLARFAKGIVYVVIERQNTPLTIFPYTYSYEE